MYVIKVCNNKELITTVRGTIYQNENNADTLVFFVPRVYEDRDTQNYSISLWYVTPDGSRRSEEIKMDDEPYNDDYYRYSLSVSSHMTAECGTVKLWLTFADLESQVLVETGEASIRVIARTDKDGESSDQDPGTRDDLEIRVMKLEAGKADGLSYDKSTNELQLTGNGAKIGNAVEILSRGDAGGDAIGWDNMDEG